MKTMLNPTADEFEERLSQIPISNADALHQLAQEQNKALREREADLELALDALEDAHYDLEDMADRYDTDLPPSVKTVERVLREVEQGDTAARIRHRTIHDVLDRLEDHIERNAEHVSPSTSAACWEVVNAMLPEDEDRALAEGDDEEVSFPSPLTMENVDAMAQADDNDDGGEN